MIEQIKTRLQLACVCRDAGYTRHGSKFFCNKILANDKERFTRISSMIPDYIQKTILADMREFYDRRNSFTDEEKEPADSYAIIFSDPRILSNYRYVSEAGYGLCYIEAAVGARKCGCLERLIKMDHRILIQGFKQSDPASHDVRKIFSYMDLFETDSKMLHALSEPLVSYVLDLKVEREEKKEILGCLYEKELRDCACLYHDLSQPAFLHFLKELGKKGFRRFLCLLRRYQKELCQSYDYETDSKDIFYGNVLLKVDDYTAITDNLEQALQSVKEDFIPLIFAYLRYVDYSDAVIKRLRYAGGELQDLEYDLLADYQYVAFTTLLFRSKEGQCLLEAGWEKDYLQRYDANKDFFVVVEAVIRKHKNFLRILSESKDAGILSYVNSLTSERRALLSLNEYTKSQWAYMVEHAMLLADRVPIPVAECSRPYVFPELKVLDRILKEVKHVEQIELLLSVYINMRKSLSVDDAVRRMEEFYPVAKTVITIDHTQVTDQSDIERNIKMTALFYADKISEQSLSEWKRMLFSILVPSELVVRALPLESLYDEMKKANTLTQVQFMLDNPKLCEHGLEDGLRQFCELDVHVRKFKEIIGKPEDFYRTFKDATEQFFMDGCAWIAVQYYENLVNAGFQSQAMKFKKILIAAVCGKLKDVRFYVNDLEKECRMNFTDDMRRVWMEDDASISKSNGMITCEDTTFKGIMEMGNVPTHTCMSYLDGIYLECLLSYFDANKKIVYVRKNGDVVGRAVIRLTKMVLHPGDADLDFVDVTNAAPIMDHTEKPIIFLEYLYSPRQGEEELQIQREIVRLVSEKAKRAGVGFATASDYHCLDDSTAFSATKQRIGVYITRSKAGVQYLDSFGGKFAANGRYENTEDCYRYASCYVVS